MNLKNLNKQEKGKKQANEKLQFSELRYRRLFETAQDGILILDALSGKIIDANPYLKRILGYSQPELLGKELWQIGVFKDIVDSKIAFEKLQAKKYIRYKDLPLQTKHGRAIEVEFISNAYMVDNQEVIQCNIRDITGRIKIEKLAKIRAAKLTQLSKAQDETKKAMLNVMEDLEEARVLIELKKIKDEAILASIGEGLIAVDNDKKVIIMNRAAENILGLKLKDMRGKEISNIPLEDEQGNLIPLNKRPTQVALSTGKMVTKTCYFVRRDKTRFPVAITVTLIKQKNKVIGALDIFRDITHEKEIDKAKSEFVSLASHQLRTPLGIIKWYLEALENEDYFNKAPRETKDYFNQIYKSNERILNLVRSLLSVSRIEQGEVKNTPKLVNPVAVLKEIIDQMQILAHKKKISLSLIPQSNDEKIPQITIDVLRFHEVIENLISNAIMYTPDLGKVEVMIAKLNQILSISVKDTGIGISQANKERLFTKFFRVETSMGSNPEGSGLGLYVVKSYVEGWGGKVSVKSAENKGTTLTISLPII